MTIAARDFARGDGLIEPKWRLPLMADIVEKLSC
jgi:hypothetical protein